MRLESKLIVVFIIFSLVLLPAYAGEWLDEFDQEELNEEWSKITDRPQEQTTFEAIDGLLLINEPLGDFGHTVTDGRPLILRKVPKGDYSVSMLVDTIPAVPASDYWLGLFIIGRDGNNAALAENWATVTIGGSAGDTKALIGSMVDNTWADKGHFDIPPWPIYLKIEKADTMYSGYYKENLGDDWKLIGAPWEHDMKNPELAGIGFVNSWGGANVTIVVESFSLEGSAVASMSVESDGKLADTWGHLKSKNSYQ